MIVNKKLDRFKQWAGERMGGEVRTNASDDFKALEQEMTVRSDGMDNLHRSMSAFVKWLSKRNDAGDKEKYTPVGFMGATMVNHGEDFDPDSEYGACLSTMGRSHERMARAQETLLADSTSTWLESLERNLVQMKEYNSARKKLEQRRLAYDTALMKMQKAKKEDFRVEEELRSQKAKYEEASEDVYRRMEEIKEAERDNIEDLTGFLEAELAYHDKCREVLMQLKRDWPGSSAGASGNSRRGPRSRSNTAHSYNDRYQEEEEPPMPEPKLTIPKLGSRGVSPRRDYGGDSPKRPSISRTNTTGTFEGPSRRADDSPGGMPRLSRVPTDSSTVAASRNNLRPVRSRGDDYDDDDRSGGRSYGRERSVSPAPIRSASWTSAEATSPASGRKGPPPPPPSRAKKPPPPPPPMKKSGLSSSEMSQY
ncbi:bar domain-containing protein [Diplodia corticola]|uniref:Bar domain-containing protein n=1 Tax=Diplodia corticola TaxID=236234 RepID=A0A1J9QT55_9PEZI|nr:bar domain-containing protein [Diplodia corticola]OJD31624.1 bar domain-containing protein [Diplodia corticola]